MASKLPGIPYPKANSNIRDTVSHQAKKFSQNPALSTYNNGGIESGIYWRMDLEREGCDKTNSSPVRNMVIAVLDRTA